MVLRTRCSPSVTTEVDTTETQYNIFESEKSSDFSNCPTSALVEHFEVLS